MPPLSQPPSSKHSDHGRAVMAGLGPSFAAPPAPAEIPEHMVVLLLEGGQRCLEKAGAAMGRQDSLLVEHSLKRFLTILQELDRRLNHEQGGELVANLTRIYAMWGNEVLAAVEENDQARLTRLFAQVGEIRRSWEQVLFRGEGMSESPGI